MTSPPSDREPAPPSWVQRLWTTPWLWLAFVIPLFCAPLFIGLDRTDLDNDEAIYSFVVETMLKDGDWLTPKSIPSESRPFLEKPPLKFWITYVPIHLGLLPDDEFGLRFMDAAMSALGFLYVFAIGRKLAGPVCGMVAVLLLFSHHALLYEHGLRSNNMESSIFLAYAAGVYHFLAWRSVNPDVKRHIYAMALWFVLGFMTKFVAALFLPVILGAAALIKREDRGRLYRDWRTFAAAAVLAVALIAPWFVYQYVSRASEPGPKVFDVMFGQHVFKRFTASLDPAHLHPWNYYFSQIWSEFRTAGTWWLVSLAAVLFAARVWFRRWIEGLTIVLWFVIPMMAISSGTSKLYHYAFPFLAPAALAGGWLVAVVASRAYRWIAAPVDSFTRGRNSVLPGWLTSARLQMVLGVTGVVSLIVAAVTAAFGRIHVTLGDVDVRNSRVIRPAAVTALAWLVGAPPQILRAAIVGGALMFALPLSAYHVNAGHARDSRLIVRPVRDCLTPIVNEQIARGRKRRGTWVESNHLSFVPFFYLRGFGAWQEGRGDSDGRIVGHLLSPDEPEFVLLSPQRYDEVIERLVSNRAELLDQAARLTGSDPAVMAERLEQISVGRLQIEDNVLLLPGPYVSCGHELIRLTSP